MCVQEDGLGWEMVLEICIELDLHKPISRVRILNIKGNILWIPLTYEKFPRVYLRCGRIKILNFVPVLASTTGIYLISV